MTKTLAARRLFIHPDYFAMAVMDPAKVQALVRHLRAGGKVPPVVAALYGDKAMPLDGHHRMEAHAILGRRVDAWAVDGDDFDELSSEERNAEAFVTCGGVPALKVAAEWNRINMAAGPGQDDGGGAKETEA